MFGSQSRVVHDKVWEDDEARIRHHYVVVASSLAEFARLACEDRLPIDYYEAKERK
ncbi:hypothetical protein SAMN05444166_0105 [Singulisphaera sp. GP187]|uniref:hypothetical protein n=1 Tax=Singulisphaera sp. GP187 TaxID=1882752 RepID=UPI00092C6DF6|nr:hypothetical protein [Singulisphaera sp. GP187]SIN68589.1 hypothetical protein SAMN05444166_0105 [Singulisphaera sp. GP187]